MEMTNYVYVHRDPTTGQVVYVGMGQRHRAWTCGAQSNSRQDDHGAWMDGLLSDGFTPDQWVEIVAKGLTRSEALKLEKELIDEYGYDTLFNRDMKGPRVFVTDEVLALREQGLSYQDIAAKVGCSTMTVWRHINK